MICVHSLLIVRAAHTHLLRIVSIHLQCIRTMQNSEATM